MEVAVPKEADVPTNIAYVSRGLQSLGEGCGGIDGYIFQLAKHMSAANAVTIIDRKYDSAEPSIERLASMTIVRLDVPLLTGGLLMRIGRRCPAFHAQVLKRIQTILFALCAKSYLSIHNFDVVHVNTTLTGLIIAYGHLNSKIVYTSHHPYWVMSQCKLDLMHGILLLLDCLLIRRVDTVIALRPACQERFVKTCCLPRNKAPVVPAGVDVTVFAPDHARRERIRKELALAGKFVILYVGSMSKIKGIIQLVEAVHTLTEAGCMRNIVVVLVGSEPEKGSYGVDTSMYGMLKNMVRTLGMGEYIRVLGRVSQEDLRALYVGTDLFVLPSLAECCPTVVLEAMASCKPVLTTSAVGAALIRNGWNGLLIRQSSKSEIAQGISSLVQADPELLRTMGKNARAFVTANHTWNQITRQLNSIYASLVGSRQTID